VASASAAVNEPAKSVAVADLPTAVAVSSAPSRPAPVAFASSRHDEARAKDTGLAGERALLEEARMALAQGSVPAAIAALTRHEQEFPRGRLVEEREAMLVQALLRAGRTAEAESRARAFGDRFPGSLLVPVVEGAVRNHQAP
jgi:outer membrane protein assembly factor BamD (BamD/ComL family)